MSSCKSVSCNYRGLLFTSRVQYPSSSDLTHVKDSRSNLLEVNEVDHHERQVEEAQQKGLSLTDGDKANAASGIAVHDDCKLRFLELKTKRTHRFIVFKIEENQKQVIVEKLGEPAQGYKDFAACLPPNECRYVIYDFEFLTEGNVPKSGIFFIAWNMIPSNFTMRLNVNQQLSPELDLFMKQRLQNYELKRKKLGTRIGQTKFPFCNTPKLGHLLLALKLFDELPHSPVKQNFR
ncbi:hypothetical protein AHAS_Ahas20G0205000 [Arachis hypogaea]